MPANKRVRLLSVRLLDTEVRRLKSLAASRGLTIQEAVRQAVEAWSTSAPNSERNDLDALEGTLRDLDLDGLRNSERQGELSKERLSI